MRQEIDRLKKQFQTDFEDMQARLKSQKDQELSEMRQKYEKIIDDLKKNSTNDREFVQKEL